jgi:transcriptional regulator GlxA family with amidase domain
MRWHLNDTPRMPRQPRTDAAHRLTIVIDRVKADLARPWCVADMAAVLGVTGGQLRRLFAESGNPPPQRLLADLRLSTAAALLRDPSLRVKDVTVRIGISDGSHFCRAFKRRYGLSPIAFQSRVLAGADIERDARARQ